jgi:hypothetical protein
MMKRALLVLLLLLPLPVLACSLNPQPLPPGDNPDAQAGSPTGNTSSGGGSNSGSGSSSGGFSSDAGAAIDATLGPDSGGTNPLTDGGTGDAPTGDALSDAPSPTGDADLGD